MLAFLIGVLVGQVATPRGARAGVSDEASRMANALDRIAAVLEKGKPVPKSGTGIPGLGIDGEPGVR